MNNKLNRGFTLVELLIAIAIVSILVAIALPSYQQFYQRERREDARHLLLLNAQRLQRCFTLEGVYNGSCVTRSLSKEGYYSLSGKNTTATTFELTATPVSGTSQAADLECKLFKYDHTGKQTAEGTDSDKCW